MIGYISVFMCTTAEM